MCEADDDNDDDEEIIFESCSCRARFLEGNELFGMDRFLFGDRSSTLVSMDSSVSIGEEEEAGGVVIDNA